ncbi:hypothetical protein H8356DRAFT_1399409 [Neocallimastix lanati (nom. inval.)]|nr:hypothetical protein H8356DRAFT_1399409 [Neocallimastix sp. JGI-2020a]
MSEPVTRAERSKVMSVDEFLKSTESETQKYESVVDSVNLTFNYCICIGETTYKDLFVSTDVANLQMNSYGLINDEAAYIVCNLYPWTLNSVTFINESYGDRKLVNDIVKQESSLPLSILAFD